MPDAVLPVLIGEDSAQVLEDVEVEFPEPAVDVEEPVKRVEIERCEVIPGKVIVIGRLVLNVAFKTRRCDGNANGNGNGNGNGVADPARTRIICGDLRHCTAFVPFRLFIEVPGAAPGDDCQVVRACVNGEVDTLIDDKNDGLFDRLLATVDIEVTVRVTRDMVVNVFGARRQLRTNFVPFPR